MPPQRLSLRQTIGVAPLASAPGATRRLVHRDRHVGAAARPRAAPRRRGPAPRTARSRSARARAGARAPPRPPGAVRVEPDRDVRADRRAHRREPAGVVADPDLQLHAARSRPRPRRAASRGGARAVLRRDQRVDGDRRRLARARRAAATPARPRGGPPGPTARGRSPRPPAAARRPRGRRRAPSRAAGPRRRARSGGSPPAPRARRRARRRRRRAAARPRRRRRRRRRRGSARRAARARRSVPCAVAQRGPQAQPSRGDLQPHAAALSSAGCRRDSSTQKTSSSWPVRASASLSDGPSVRVSDRRARPAPPAAAPGRAAAARARAGRRSR